MHQRPQITSRPNPVRRNIKRKSSNDTGPRFLLGLDLGQARDYTAMVIVERILPSQPGERVEYHVRHLERYNLGTPYPEIVDDMAELLDERPLAGRTKFIVDGTGVGVPVVEMFRDAGLSPLPIWITGGDAVSRKGRIIRVPKRDLVSVLQVLFQSRRLKVSRSLELGAVLIEELVNFRVKITANANDTYGAWREGTHDDLVLALSLACWTGERMLRQPRTTMHIEDVKRTKR